MSKYLVVGAGLSGATIARLAAEDGVSVDVIEQRDHIGGNTFDYLDPDTGIRVSKYGAHIFHTNNEDVWQFVNRFSDWTPYEHRVLSYVNGKYVPVPVNIQTVNEVLGLNIQSQEEMAAYLDSVQYKGEVTNSKDAARARVGDELYKLMFENYTKKQWDKYPEELEPEVLARIPVRDDNNDRYFSDSHEALPAEGYTAFVSNMLDHPNITVSLSTPFISAEGYDKVFYTGRVDTYFKDKHGPLEYRSLRFEETIEPIDSYQPMPVVNYPSIEYPFTRVIEYKKFYPTQGDTDRTIVVREYSTATGEAYYPVPNQLNRDRYALYQAEAEQLEHDGVYFVGRLANYKYFNMDAAIANALEVYDKSK